MIKKYRKKDGSIIEATQLAKVFESILECERFMGLIKDTDNKHGQDLIYNYCDGIAKEGIGIKFKTFENDNETQIALFGDYIIKGTNGEFYKCESDIFEKTHQDIEKRQKNDLGDLIINGKLTVQELYDFAKENNALDSSLYFVNKKEGGTMNDTIYCQNVSHFGKGWGKGTIMIHTTYKEDKETDACCDSSN